MKPKPPCRNVLSRQYGQCSEMLQLSHDQYITSVTSSISKCVDDLVITKTIKSFPNQKAWMTGEVRALFRAKKAAFRPGDREVYIITRARLKPGNEVERDIRRDWRGTSTPTALKTSITPPLKHKFWNQILVNFYRGAIKSILTANITHWRFWQRFVNGDDQQMFCFLF